MIARYLSWEDVLEARCRIEAALQADATQAETQSEGMMPDAIRRADVTPADLFHRAGVALFGEQYVAPMAVLLDADKNQVGKWRSGKSRIPAGVWGPIRAALLKRGPEIEGVLLEIGNQGLGTTPTSSGPSAA